ncbi:imm11 family protein [Clostridium manihotivorum]|uniref:Immunity MXAN-0049 protein domain-containing protein n=1 Tax=Clostridium manihotivorum TaxID=2320868 RepID=A0A3R5U7W1_9CLOT|nr:DUF1629 domain-containing protein [Clostridium manihotivorum]QAA34158.1 hypothetical protein C1I91_22390 [Clostridium manihotivorum]
MKIWKIDKNVNDFAGFFLEDEDNKAILEEFLDKGIYIDKWSELELRACDTDKPFADCLHLWSGGNPLIVSEKAKEIMSSKFNEHVQFLPMIYKRDNKNYYVMNILSIIDCVDYEKSDLKILMDKYIIDVNKYCFNENAKKVPIFKIYLDGVIKRIDSFVNDEFKNLIEDSGLEGFKFTEVFDFEA